MSNEVQIIDKATPAVVEAQTVAAPAVNQFADDGFNLVADITAARTQYCSMTAETEADKANLFNAMNNPDERLSKMINRTIEVKDVYIEVVPCTNEETGEVTMCPRIVIIDAKGKSYQCVSVGVYSALKKIIQVYGEPTWEKPIKIEVQQITKGTRNMLTLKVVA